MSMSRPTSACRLAQPVVTALLLALVVVVGCSEEGANAQEKAPADPAMKAIDAFIKERKIDTQGSKWKTRLPKPPLATFDPNKTYVWKLITNHGEIRIKLLTDVAPMHATSTLYLTRLGFYDGITFHRVIKGFMAQGGDPLGNGRGGPGYKYAGEFDPKVRHDVAGTLSMANAGPRTDGSQFFLTFKPTPGLDDKHTVFGRTEAGASMETLRKIESLGRQRDPAPPSMPVIIERATIRIE
jgi:peptidyl-prolyl cis-trans isomerase B (cyclophilin B)